MITTTVVKLRFGDVFTADEGATWWKVYANDHERKGGRRLFSECVQANADAEVVAGDVESAVYDADKEVILRVEGRGMIDESQSFVGKRIEQVRCEAPEFQMFVGRKAVVQEAFTDEKGQIHVKTDDGVWCLARLVATL